MALLNSLFSFLIRPDSDSFLDGRNEDFSVPNFARLGGLDDGGDGTIKPLVAHDDFEFYFGQKIHRVFAAATTEAQIGSRSQCMPAGKGGYP